MVLIERYRIGGTRAPGSAAAIEDAGRGVPVHAAVPNPSPSASASRNADTDHRWLSTILKTSCANQRSVPRNADTLRLKESALRSWRAVETAGRQSAVAIIGVNSEGFPDSASRFDRNCRGKDAGKVGMQCATRIGQICAVVAVMRGAPFTGVVVAKLMMVRIGCVQNRRRAGARGRHDAGELRDHEQGDQQPHKPAYRPKPIHLRVDRSPPKNRCYCGLIGLWRQSRWARAPLVMSGYALGTASLGDKRDQVADVRLALQGPCKFNNALRALGTDDRRRVGQELRFDGCIAHRIGGGAAGVGNVSYVSLASGHNRCEGFVGT